MATREQQWRDFEACTELVIVCCHATYTGKAGDLATEKDWLLQPFQRADPSVHKHSEIGTFLTHIFAGAQLCQRSGALLMFSGGRTSESKRSEAESCCHALRRLIANGMVSGAEVRIAKEQYATDSYQNLLFSIVGFHRLTGRCPEYVTVITHAFKERRFFDLHAPAIKWPLSKLRVQGVNPPFTLEELEQTQELEYERAYKLFEQDPYGVRSPLADKRRARNWDPAAAQDLAVEESVQQLLEWTGGDSGREAFPGQLPWEDE